ncbi:DEAD/DEAH box helicase [Candidatus Woesearchaeota archaeon]|nr:DEAD/DEAH box helicase [Candidatus Woesearchaeota archaeon]
MKKFEELGIMNPVLKTIKEEGFDSPTEIQEKSIPIVLQGKDIIGGSATGSGKTLAYACAIIHKTEKGQGIQAIVLTPTRELAEQVSKSIQKFSRYKHLNITKIYGGVSINPQIENLKHADVVVGTPGRVLDHLSRGKMDLSKIKVAVLDEADRMLDMGFIDDVSKILSQCPKKRQTLLYSATIHGGLSRLAKNHMNNPVEISVDSYVDPSKLSQVYYEVPSHLKFSLLVHLLKRESSGLAMVFCNTQRVTDFVARNLQNQNIKAMAIHGGLSQARRTKTMKRFHSGKASVLVCTDVASRGLHVEDVSHIYNYDIPTESKQYIHRIGRTARAGKEGKAISILTRPQYDTFDRVLNELHIDIKKEDAPRLEKVIVSNMRRGNKHITKNRNDHKRRSAKGRWQAHSNPSPFRKWVYYSSATRS